MVEDVKAYDSFGCCDHKTKVQDPMRNDPMGISLEGQRGSEQLANLQGQAPQSTRMVHFCVWKVEQAWQKASMDEHVDPDLTQTLFFFFFLRTKTRKVSLSRSAAKGRLRGIWAHCSMRQGT